MKKLGAIFIAGLLVTMFGCVSSGEYNARLSDIDNLKKDVSGLDAKLKQKEAEKAAVEAELAKLNMELENLKKQNKTLADDNAGLDNLLKAKKDELSAKVSELRGKLSEKETELAAKNTELDALKKQIAALTQEKDALNQEKEKALREKEKSVAEMKKTYDSLMGEMNSEIKKGEITITQLKDKLSVNLVEQILFDSGSAEIKKDGKKVLERVAEILKKVADKQVRVEGHTDNVPIGPRLQDRFPSNWELSAARATNVAKYLQDKGIDPKLLSACGYSQYRPVALNDTDEGKAKNRRIEIALIPKEIDRVVEEGTQK